MNKTSTYIVKMCNKSKLKYENIEAVYTDNGVVLDGIDEEMFIPYGSIEYIIRKKNPHEMKIVKDIIRGL